MTLQNNARHHQNEKLINALNKLQGATVSGVTSSTLQTTAEDFFEILEKLPFDLLPYAAVSQFVYNEENEDILYFTEKLEEFITKKYSRDSDNYKKGIKMIEHMELAKQQKDFLFEKHENEIATIKRITRRTMIKSNKIEELQNTTQELQEDNKSMMTNYISILGIFAAILMGAFGAIQGFASLFENAYSLSIGKLLIMSSIGASSVLLILFFLLNGIAKLTERSLWSTDKVDGTLLEKHPSLVITHGILIFISLVGAALELSNLPIKFAWQGLWWIFPGLWFIYLIIAFSTKRLIPSIDSELSETKK